MEATGFLPFGVDWPFAMKEKRTALHDAHYSDDEEDDTMQERSMYENRRDLLWDIILESVTEDPSACTTATLELSDPTIFMFLGPNTEVLNDLIFLNWLKGENNALTYMAQTLLQRKWFFSYPGGEVALVFS